MRVTCAHCQAGYTVPDDKLSGGRRLQFSCRHCGERVLVEAPAKQASPAAGPISASLTGQASARRPSAGAISPTAASKQPRWFVANPDGSHQKLAESELRSLVEAGAVAGETLVWRKGFAAWTAAAETAPWDALFRGRAASRPKSVAEQPSPVAPSGPAPKPAARPASQPIRRRRRQTERGVVSEVAHPAAASAAPNQRVAGVVEPKTEQQAVSLPIVRPRRTTGAERAADGGPGGGLPSPRSPRPAHSAERFSPRAAPQGTPMDRRAEAGAEGGTEREPDEDGGSWAPATDTYIGPRDRYTRRLGSGAQREALLAQVDRESQLRRSLRRWQWVALGSACAAILAFTLAVVMLVQLRSAEASACTEAPASGEAATGGEAAAPKEAASHATAAKPRASKRPRKD